MYALIWAERKDHLPKTHPPRTGGQVLKAKALRMKRHASRSRRANDGVMDITLKRANAELRGQGFSAIKGVKETATEVSNRISAA